MRVGVVGCGTVAEFHLSAIRRIKRAEIVAVCDPDRSRLAELSERFGIAGAYTDAAAMLEERKPEAVHVLVPTRLHKTVAIEAMERGCHVLVEKPMAIDVPEADEMINASRRHGVLLGVCHNHLFDPVMLQAKAMASSGVLGEIVSLDTYWRLFYGVDPDPVRGHWMKQLPGGPLHEVLPHPLYLQSEFLEDLQIVSAVTQPPGERDEPQEFRILFAGTAGLASLCVARSTGPLHRYMYIRGTQSTLRLDFTNNTLVVFRTEGKEKFSKAAVNLDQVQQLLCSTVRNAAEFLIGRRLTGHQRIIRKFYEACENGGKPPVTEEDGRRNVALLDAIWAVQRQRTMPRAAGG